MDLTFEASGFTKQAPSKTKLHREIMSQKTKTKKQKKEPFLSLSDEAPLAFLVAWYILVTVKQKATMKYHVSKSSQVAIFK